MNRLTNPRNRLLRAIPPSLADRIIANSVHVDFPIGTNLFSRDERPRYLHFLTSGVGSVVFTSSGGTTVELSTQGTEGLIGWAFLFGPALKVTDCIVQVAGTGYRTPVAYLQREFDNVPELRQRVLEYAQHQNLGSFQIAACNRLHRAEARFSRWLLMVSDRLGGDDIAMTQEFLAMMLGARRTTVSEVCASLERAGAIEGRRGGLRIVSRQTLERHACECYRILRKLFDDLYCTPVHGTKG